MSALVDELARLIVGDNAILLVGSMLGGGRPPIVEQIAQALAERIHSARAAQGLPAVARDFEVLQGGRRWCWRCARSWKRRGRKSRRRSMN